MHAMILNCLVWFGLHCITQENLSRNSAHRVDLVGGSVGGTGAFRWNLAHWCTKLHKLLTYSNQWEWEYEVHVCVCVCGWFRLHLHPCKVLAKTNIELNKLQNCTDDERSSGAFFGFRKIYIFAIYECQAIVAILVAIVTTSQPFVYYTATSRILGEGGNQRAKGNKKRLRWWLVKWHIYVRRSQRLILCQKKESGPELKWSQYQLLARGWRSVCGFPSPKTHSFFFVFTLLSSKNYSIYRRLCISNENKNRNWNMHKTAIPSWEALKVT